MWSKSGITQWISSVSTDNAGDMCIGMQVIRKKARLRRAKRLK